MTSVLIRDLPEETHRRLMRRAEERGQSLQQYLTAELNRLATTPTMEDVFHRIETRRSGGHVGLAQAADDVADERR